MNINELKTQLENREIKDQFSLLAELFKERIVFTTSFGIEDQVISHIIFENDIPVRVITLDTGRLFPETYRVFNETMKRYGKRIEAYFPDYMNVEKMVTKKGPFSFYYSKENRVECCRIRKVEPLTRALSGMECWISGIRSEQSSNRSRMDWIEFDENKNMIKFYPLFGWTFEQVENYVRENKIPCNVLHGRGYISIGCEPCTRAVREGEDFRSGRWWWESGSEKECGLHK